MSNTKTRSIAVGAALGLVTMAGVSFAAFQATSSFTVEGATGQLAPVQIDADIQGQMWPGQLNDVTATIYNPNPVAVKITSASPLGFAAGNTVDAKDLTGNSAAGSAVVNTEIPAKGKVEVKVEDAIGLKATADNDSAGKVVKINMSAQIETAAE